MTIGTTEPAPAASAGAGTARTPPEPVTRSLILGVDRSGVIRQSDRAAEALLGPLCGRALAEIFGTAPADRLLTAVRDGREAEVQVTVDGSPAVAALRPMGEGGPAALVLVALPERPRERFHDRAVMRRALLDDTLAWTGSILDPEQMSRGLMSLLVPHFCNSAALLLRESLVGDGDPPPEDDMLRRMAVSADDDDPAWDAAFPTGEVLAFPAGTPYARCLETGRAMSVLHEGDSALRLAGALGRRPMGALLKGTSMLLLPLVAGGSVLGFFVCTRNTAERPFDGWDVEIGREFADRAAVHLDNARRYSRERATALTLQRSLLPAGLSAPWPVEVHHRYLPGSRLMEVGGDWYESIALPGGRVALVVGDVAGHGVQAAVTMGRLRTAIHTLAALELPPAEALERLDALMETLGDTFATCAYGVYDAVSGILEVASAGHLRPLVVPPDDEPYFLEVPTAPPLGAGALGSGVGPITSREFTIDDGSLLVLFTDGLVENRTCDIDAGLARLRRAFDEAPADGSLADLGRRALDGVYSDHHRDDIAFLIARLGRIPADRHVTWELPAVPSAVREARTLLRERMARWGLDHLSFTAELVATELLTNAVQHVGGRMALGLVREESALIIEIYDTSDAMPHARPPELEVAETGRGLQVVARLARRWGVRRTIAGKVVWGELPLT